MGHDDDPEEEEEQPMKKKPRVVSQEDVQTVKAPHAELEEVNMEGRSADAGGCFLQAIRNKINKTTVLNTVHVHKRVPLSSSLLSSYWYVIYYLADFQLHGIACSWCSRGSPRAEHTTL